MTPELKNKFRQLFNSTGSDDGFLRQKPFDDKVEFVSFNDVESFIDTHFIERSEVEKMINDVFSKRYGEDYEYGLVQEILSNLKKL